jgi:ATP-binding cassette, subfamily B, bacterial PglK
MLVTFKKMFIQLLKKFKTQTKVFFSISQKNELIKLLFSVIILTLLEIISVGLIIPLIIILISPNFFERFDILNEILIMFQLEMSDLIFIILGSIIIIYSLKTLIQYRILIFQSSINIKLVNSLRYRLLEAHLNKDYSFYFTKSFNDVKTLINISCYDFVFFYVNGMINLISEIIIVIGMICLLIVSSFLFFALDFSFFLIIFSMIGLVYLYFILLRKKQKNIGKVFNNTKFSLFKLNNQAISFFRENKLFNSTKYFLDQLLKKNQEHSQSAVFLHAANYFPRLFLEFFFMIGSLTVVFFLLITEVSSTKILTIVSTYGIVSFRMFPSFNKIMVNFQNLKHFEYVKSILIEVLNNDDPTILNSKNLKFRDRIKLENVSFRYNDKNILNNINLEINKGDKVCILGPSGSGKSTLVNLIMGLLKPSDGKIYVDNKIISTNQDIHSWQNNISLVPQDIVLLNDTILNNIIISDTNKKTDTDLVNQLIENFELKNFIVNSKNKLDTIISDGHLNMSGGQKQRLALVRAFYKNPSIIVLDEATNSLDNKTAKNILDNLIKFQDDKTIIFVTHDEKIKRYCSKIIELSN